MSLASALTHDDRASTSACVAFAEILRTLLVAPAPPTPTFYWEEYVRVAAPLEGERALRPRREGDSFEGPLWRYIAETLPPPAFDRGDSLLALQHRTHSGAYMLETMPLRSLRARASRS